MSTSLPEPHYHPTSSFSRLPSPPRIPVPSALPTTASISDLTPLSPTTIQDWTYAARHTAQTLLPSIMLGPTHTAKDPSFLTAHSPTLLLHLRTNLPAAHAASAAVTRAASPLGIASLSLPTPTTQSLASSFDTINNAITAHLAERPDGKVLLHCETGNERAPLAVAAYLMASRGVDCMAAMQYVQTARFSSTFDEERRRVLQGYGDVLVARRAVGGDAGIGMGKRKWDGGEEGQDRGRAPFVDG